METIKSCKATHGKYNLDNGNIVIQVDVELDTKEITKNIAIEVEKFITVVPEVKQQRDELLEELKKLNSKLHCSSDKGIAGDVRITKVSYFGREIERVRKLINSIKENTQGQGIEGEYEHG